MPLIGKLNINFKYKDESFKICKYIVSAVGIFFEIEDISGNHESFFTLETICNNAKEKLQEEYPEFFI